MPHVLASAPAGDHFHHGVPPRSLEVDVDHPQLRTQPAHDGRHRPLTNQPQAIPQRRHHDPGHPLVLAIEREPATPHEQQLVEVTQDTRDTPTSHGCLSMRVIGVFIRYGGQQKATSLLGTLKVKSRDLRQQVFALHRLRAAAGKRRLSRS